jgi:hypothetical protein
MNFDNVLSKVLAAGLAAGLFLLWWPTHLPATGVPWLVLRGVAWALVFEILVLSPDVRPLPAHVQAARRADAGQR